MSSTYKPLISISIIIIFVLLTSCSGSDDNNSSDIRVSSISSSDTPVAIIRKALPVAVAGRDVGAITGQSLTLDASFSFDDDGDQLSYKWSIYSSPKQSNASLILSNTPNPEFLPDIDGKYILSLVVSDSVDGSSTDFITITASPTGNTPPECILERTASATTDQPFVLENAPAIDEENDALSYLWSLDAKPSQSTATLHSTTERFVSFTPDKDGEYFLSVIISDGIHNSQPCAFVISSSEVPNVTPVARSGSGYGIYTNTTFTIKGDNSLDPDGSILNYYWEVINAPFNSTIEITDSAEKNVELNVNTDGLYVLKLTVDDNISKSQPKLIYIFASSNALIPQNNTDNFSSICFPTL